MESFFGSKNRFSIARGWMSSAQTPACGFLLCLAAVPIMKNCNVRDDFCGNKCISWSPDFESYRPPSCMITP